jgi:hypothetical protein
VPAAGAQPGGSGGRGGLGGPGRDDPANAGVDYSPKPPVKVLPPADELKHFQLQTGYRVELVLAGPDIAEPAAITFDGNGRMYVTEIRSYMNDADGTDTLTPTGRISRHEDVDNDGVYERHTVFVDKLTFPRFAMPLGADAILTKNSNDPDVWKYTDTNGDGVADKRELFATDFGRGGNVEHQERHLTWAMDNWLHTHNAVRLRWTPHGVLREPWIRRRLGGPGQRRQDLIQGGERAARYYQLPLAYGNFAIPGMTGSGSGPRGARRSASPTCSPACPRCACRTVRCTHRPPGPAATFSVATAAGSRRRLLLRRGARIVRRIKPEAKGSPTSRTPTRNSSSSGYRSAFRSVDQATAPDGTIPSTCIGIIQNRRDAARTYLRAKIEQYQLDKSPITADLRLATTG